MKPLYLGVLPDDKQHYTLPGKQTVKAPSNAQYTSTLRAVNDTVSRAEDDTWYRQILLEHGERLCQTWEAINQGEFGTVIAGSGAHHDLLYADAQGKTRGRKDWALLEITTNTRLPAVEDINKYPDYRECRQQETFLTRLGPAALPNSPQYLTRVASATFRLGAVEIWKAGAASGYTKALRNSVVSAVRFDHEPPDILGSIEHAYLSEDTDQKVSNRGDSGAACWDVKGDWFGLVFGGCEGWRDHRTYIEPAEWLLFDVFEHAGLLLKFPQMPEGEFLVGRRPS